MISSCSPSLRDSEAELPPVQKARKKSAGNIIHFEAFQGLSKCCDRKGHLSSDVLSRSALVRTIRQGKLVAPNSCNQVHGSPENISC